MLTFTAETFPQNCPFFLKEMLDLIVFPIFPAIFAIFFTLRLAGVGGKVFAQIVERQGCLLSSAWMELLSLREDFAANTLPNKAKQTGNPCNFLKIMMFKQYQSIL